MSLSVALPVCRIQKFWQCAKSTKKSLNFVPFLFTCSSSFLFERKFWHLFAGFEMIEGLTLRQRQEQHERVNVPPFFLRMPSFTFVLEPLVCNRSKPCTNSKLGLSSRIYDVYDNPGSRPFPKKHPPFPNFWHPCRLMKNFRENVSKHPSKVNPVVPHSTVLNKLQTQNVSLFFLRWVEKLCFLLLEDTQHWPAELLLDPEAAWIRERKC